MAKNFHEIRDPIHNFIYMDSDERKILDSRPLQRLRNIHQLALTSFVYPGATHRRFEHSLGVMELASRVFDVVTKNENILHDSVKDIMPPSTRFAYWREVIRMAALCHDIGHLPFSHAAEKKLLPEGCSHETLTKELILSAEMRSIWKNIKIQAEDVAKLAVGPKYFPDEPFTDWESILSEIIIGDTLGVDRIDYLLRDSHHCGVAYGKFDHYRLIDTIRILPKEYTETKEPALGIEAGGLHATESMLLARYFMYTQLYFHSVRRIYDKHLMDFLNMHFENGLYPADIDGHLNITDCEMMAELFEASRNRDHKGHENARIIINREHFKLLYERDPDDLKINADAAEIIYQQLCKEYGEKNVHYDSYRQKGEGYDFPVLRDDNHIVSSLAVSDVLSRMPLIAIDYIYVARKYITNANDWLNKNKRDLLEIKEEEI